MRPTRTPELDQIERQIGGLVRMGRLAAGMTQEQLAEPLGRTCQQIARYENGMDRVVASRLCQIADVFGVDRGALLPPRADPRAVQGMSTDELVRLMDRPDVILVLLALKTIREIRRRAALIEMVVAYADKYGKK